MQEINTRTLLAVSMAIRIRWYGAERITQYSSSRATLVIGHGIGGTNFPDIMA